jgi:large subunit ribosomal protein L22
VVLEHIRGRTVPEARTVLAFTQRAAAREIEKVLRSAVANAEANHGLSGDDLIVVAAYADDGPTIKRWRARARGRVNRIRKRTCHITVRLTPAERSGLATASEEAKPKRRSAPKATNAESKPAAKQASPRQPQAGADKTSQRRKAKEE